MSKIGLLLIFYVNIAGKAYIQDKVGKRGALLSCILCMKVIRAKKELRDRIEIAYQIE
jgi:hypothetical protein